MARGAGALAARGALGTSARGVVSPTPDPWQRSSRDKSAGKNTDPKMVEFRWMLEELRVSLFAQELRTPMPVSSKRLQKVWESMLR